MATISNTPRPGYVWDVTDNVWYPIGVGGHSHSEIAKTIADAKGDLIVGTAADTVDRLAVGNNGETLVADSAAATGLRYQSAKTTNGLYNSSFQVWQRGTTNVTTANAYTADRWQKGGGTHYGVSRQVTGDTTNLPFIQYCARVQRTASSATVSGIDLAQTLETLDAIKYAGKTVTISFYARAGANYSSASNALTALIYSGTGTDQSVAGGFTGLATAFTSTNTLTTTWQRFQATGTISASATEIAFYTNYTPVGTAGANDYYEITGCQIEYGSVATSYTSMTGTIQGELAACQRYYWRNNVGANAYGILGTANGDSATVAYGSIIPNVTMRAINSITSSNIALLDGAGGLVSVTLTLQSNYTSTNIVGIRAGAASGITALRSYFIHANNSTSGFVAVEGEL